MQRFLLILLCLATLSCSEAREDGSVVVGVIGEPGSVFSEDAELPPAAHHLRAATAEGLVALDPVGEIVPALAERWIITDDGLSYIFRLRSTDWADGEPINGEDIKRLLDARLSALATTPLGLDLAKVMEIRAMTGRVVEVRLSGPMPEFLRLLAQPELGLTKDDKGTGPMLTSGDAEDVAVQLNAIPPEQRGLPALQDWEEQASAVTIRALPVSAALDAFANGEIDVLINGRLADFPEVELGPLSRGAIQLDPTYGLFGLVFLNDDGFLEDADRREALSMAIDRGQLLQDFALDGWESTTWLVPSSALGDLAPVGNRWNNLTIEERQGIAARRLSRFLEEAEEPVTLRLAMPAGRGSTFLFNRIAANWRPLGIAVQRVKIGEPADIQLIDRLARYSSPRWFLNQFHCSLERGICSEEADTMIEESLAVRDPRAKQFMLADAHQTMLAEELYIPLGSPVRWSLVRGAIDAFEINPWGIHPLFPLSQPTT